MPTTPPFSPSLPIVAAAAGLTAAPDAAPAVPANGAFAALIGARLTPNAAQAGMATANLATAQATATPSPPKAVQVATKAALAAAKTALLATAGTGVITAVKTAPDTAPSEIPAVPVVIVPANVAETIPSDTALTQAVGGKDGSTDAANAAIAAAIDAGVAPKPSERLVQAASLPVAVQTAASVRVLDRLLDDLDPTQPRVLAQAEAGMADTAGTAGTAGMTVPAAAPPPSQTAPNPSGVASLASNPAPDPRPAPRKPDAALVIARPDMPKPDPVSHEATPARQTFTNSANLVEAPPAAVAAPDQSDTDTPDDSPGTPLAQGEPAAPNNGKSAAHPSELLRQRLERIGLDGSPSLTIDRGAAAEPSPVSPAALSHGILVAPASAMALAAYGVATAGAPGQGTMASPSNGANGMLAAGVAGINAGPTGAWQSSLGQGNGHGGGSADGKSLQAALDGDGGAPGGADATGDGGPSFGALLTGQASGTPVARPTSASAPPLPAPPPTITPDQVAVHIAAAARNGERQISVQLRPASLGRIDVQLSVDRDGSVRTRVLAERPETLDLLRRDAGGLERALEAAGLHAETGGLSFGLKDGSGQNGRAWFADAPMPSSLIATLDGDRAQAMTTALPPAPLDGRALDIRV